MKPIGALSAVFTSISLLLAPVAFAQQETGATPQEPMEMQQEAAETPPPPPTSPTVEEPVAQPEAQRQDTEAQRQDTGEAAAQQSIPLAAGKPTQQQPLVASSTIVGAMVKNPQGEDLGEIQELMIDPKSGRIVHALLSFGGVLGVGQKQVAIPWETFKMGLGQEEFVVELSKEQLQNVASAEESQQSTVTVID